MDISPELKALLNCRPALFVCIRNGLYDFARYFLDTDIINNVMYDEVTKTKSYMTYEEKADIILQQLNDKIQEDPSFYFIFKDYLMSRKQYSKLIKELNEEYSKSVKQMNDKKFLLKMKSKWITLCA